MGNRGIVGLAEEELSRLRARVAALEKAHAAMLLCSACRPCNRCREIQSAAVESAVAGLDDKGEEAVGDGWLGSLCPSCGFGVGVDEDGGCTSCGATAVGEGVDEAVRLRSRVAELKTERADFEVLARARWRSVFEVSMQANQRAEAAEATRDRLQDAGYALATCAFNLKQRDHLTDRERRSLAESQEAWDAVLDAERNRTEPESLLDAVRARGESTVVDEMIAEVAEDDVWVCDCSACVARRAREGPCEECGENPCQCCEVCKGPCRGH